VIRAALPDTIKARFPNKGEDAKGSEISYVHNMVFGANGSYMLAWKGANGKNYEGSLSFLLIYILALTQARTSAVTNLLYSQRRLTSRPHRVAQQEE